MLYVLEHVIPIVLKVLLDMSFVGGVSCSVSMEFEDVVMMSMRPYVQLFVAIYPLWFTFRSMLCPWHKGKSPFKVPELFARSLAGDAVLCWHPWWQKAKQSHFDTSEHTLPCCGLCHGPWAVAKSARTGRCKKACVCGCTSKVKLAGGDS